MKQTWSVRYFFLHKNTHLLNFYNFVWDLRYVGSSMPGLVNPTRKLVGLQQSLFAELPLP